MIAYSRLFGQNNLWDRGRRISYTNENAAGSWFDNTHPERLQSPTQSIDSPYALIFIAATAAAVLYFGKKGGR